MDDLLKEAIADAKVVRDTAVENARLALAEAFTPKIQSMLTQKIRQEVEDENQEDEMKDEAMDDEVEDEGEEVEEGYGDEGEHDDEGEEVKEIEDEVEDEGEEVAEIADEVEDEDEDVAEIEDEVEDEGEHDDEDDDLDLESILRELEKEVEDEDDEVEEISHADEDEELEEELKSSDVGAADNKLDKDAESSSDIGKADKAKHTEGVEDEGEHDDEEVDEDIDLEEILKALSEVEDEDEEVEENVEEIAQLKSELEEYRNAVKYMRGKLNEVNLLNAKLLFTNKLFRAFGLSEGDKYRVVETFDRAKNLREVKLVYATLAESFGQKPKIQESKGKSSKPVASTQPKNESKVISEGNDLKNRFKKLANII